MYRFKPRLDPLGHVIVDFVLPVTNQQFSKMFILDTSATCQRFDLLIQTNSNLRFDKEGTGNFVKKQIQYFQTNRAVFDMLRTDITLQSSVPRPDKHSALCVFHVQLFRSTFKNQSSLIDENDSTIMCKTKYSFHHYAPLKPFL